MQGGLGVSPVNLCVGKFRGAAGRPNYSTRKLGVKFNDRALLGTVDASTPLSNFGRLGESHGPCVVWVKLYTLARL